MRAERAGDGPVSVRRCERTPGVAVRSPLTCNAGVLLDDLAAGVDLVERAGPGHVEVGGDGHFGGGGVEGSVGSWLEVFEGLLGCSRKHGDGSQELFNGGAVSNPTSTADHTGQGERAKMPSAAAAMFRERANNAPTAHPTQQHDRRELCCCAHISSSSTSSSSMNSESDVSNNVNVAAIVRQLSLGSKAWV
jgi:hypothetical protein